MMAEAANQAAPTMLMCVVASKTGCVAVAEAQLPPNHGDINKNVDLFSIGGFTDGEHVMRIFYWYCRWFAWLFHWVLWDIFVFQSSSFLLRWNDPQCGTGYMDWVIFVPCFRWGLL